MVGSNQRCESMSSSRIKRNLKQSMFSTSFTKFCFSGQSENRGIRPGLWLAETFSSSSLQPWNRIHRNSSGSKCSTSSTNFVFFGLEAKPRWPPWHLIDWEIFDFSWEPLNRILGHFSGSKISTSCTNVCVQPLDRVRRNLKGSKI